MKLAVDIPDDVYERVKNTKTIETADYDIVSLYRATKNGTPYEERPQGKWIDEGQYAEGHDEHAYACKNCDYHIIELPNMVYENRFCKNCGADMRKGGKESGTAR